MFVHQFLDQIAEAGEPIETPDGLDSEAAPSGAEANPLWMASRWQSSVARMSVNHLVNRILGEQRVVVFDEAGTTRDSIYIPFERDGETYTLIDTAGVRRRGRISASIEKFSVIKTLDAIQDAHVVLLLVDAHEGLVDQDLHLLGHALEAGERSLFALTSGMAPRRAAIESISNLIVV